MAISINRAIGINSPTSPKSSQVISYTKSLSEKYDYFNNKTSVSGIPTTVKVSSAFIRQCSNDPEKAQKLEEHLNAIPKCVETAIKGCLGTITNLSYSIDSKGNMSVAISGSSDPDGKIARENAERKAKEKKASEEKIKAQRAKKAEEEELIMKRFSEKNGERKISSSGTSVTDVTDDMILQLSDLSGFSFMA